jgi:hypothetical protein
MLTRHWLWWRLGSAREVSCIGSMGRYSLGSQEQLLPVLTWAEARHQVCYRPPPAGQSAEPVAESESTVAATEHRSAHQLLGRLRLVHRGLTPLTQEPRRCLTSGPDYLRNDISTRRSNLFSLTLPGCLETPLTEGEDIGHRAQQFLRLSDTRIIFQHSK